MKNDKITIRCSSLERVLKCSMSLNLPAITNTSNKFSIAGTNQHSYAQAAITKNIISDQISPTTEHYIGVVKGLIDKAKAYGVEKTYETYLIKSFILHGTPDFWCIIDETLHIVDLKSGHVPVIPCSPQLIGYAFLLLKHVQHPIKYVSLKICQGGDSNDSVLTPTEIFEFINVDLMASLEHTTFEMADHCRYCPSKIHCKKQIGALTDLTNFNYKNVAGEYIYSLLKKSQFLKNVTDELEDYLFEICPAKFKTKTSKYKRWVDETLAPFKVVRMTPTDALTDDPKNPAILKNIELEKRTSRVLI